MKILHLPNNIASQIGTTVRALRELGVEARGLAYPHTVLDNTLVEHLRVVPRLDQIKRRQDHIKRWMGLGANNLAILRGIAWAEVVHYHFEPGMRHGRDLGWLRFLRKPGLVEFWGADIRNREIEIKDNPYVAAVLQERNEYKSLWQAEQSRQRQIHFASAGVAVNVPSPSMEDYLVPNLFHRRFNVRQRVWLDDYVPTYPDPYNARPKLVHSPTNPHFKGSAVIEAAVDALSSQYQLEYERVQNRPHREAREVMRQCDIFIDQVILGDHGLAAIEAMAFGKPVVCYLKPSVRARLPKDLPIVSATPEDLPQVLARLLSDGPLRAELGRRGRNFVKKHHDARVIAREFLEIYKELLGHKP